MYIDHHYMYIDYYYMYIDHYDISGTTAKTSTEGVPTSTTTGPQISSPEGKLC